MYRMSIRSWSLQNHSLINPFALACSHSPTADANESSC
jgi:hypothetical protein